ncbi:MAG: rhomboid family intramembrane serine protease [Erysipelotrichaceae bacterium]|nr:rhomboid family intramembrane serine protease [Erysipelotrichaceae bacterium]
MLLITNIYIVICVIVWAYINFISHDDKYDSAMRLGGFYMPAIDENNEYWRFITCHFIHVDFIHLLMNMYSMYVLGSSFEYILGTVGYLYLIIVSMIISMLITYISTQMHELSYYTLTIGASGVVYGFFGAMIALGILIRGPYLSWLMSGLYVILINLVYTFINKDISKTGHIGGLVGGIVAVVFLLLMGFI